MTHKNSFLPESNIESVDPCPSASSGNSDRLWAEETKEHVTDKHSITCVIICVWCRIKGMTRQRRACNMCEINNNGTGHNTVEGLPAFL